MRTPRATHPLRRRSGGASPYVGYLQQPWALAGVDRSVLLAAIGGENGIKRPRMVIQRLSGVKQASNAPVWPFLQFTVRSHVPQTA